MAQPGDVGEAFIELHSDGKALPGEFERDTKRAAEAVEDDFKPIGDKWGKKASDGLGDRMEREAPTIARKVERGLTRQKVTTKVRVEYDRDNNVTKRFVETVAHSLEGAFEDAGRPGGPLSRIGSGISDAIGAGFNVSGKSPLIAFLIPLVGTIVALVLAAVQAVTALVAALTTVPLLIGGILAQVGVLMVAFHGVGEAIGNAFAAKNAKELKEALKGLTPAAQSFIKEMLPFKKFLADSGKLIQENLFLPLKGDVTGVFLKLGQQIRDGMGGLATELGTLIHDLLQGISGPTGQNFFIQLFDSTKDFLAEQGPKIIDFLGAIAKLTTFARPLLDDIGRMFGGNLEHLANLLNDIAESGKFQAFLAEMSDTLASVVELLFKAVDFIATFMAVLNEAGGNSVIDALADAFEQLSFFLASPVGVEALKGLIGLVIVLTQVTFGLIETILLVLAAFQFVYDFVSGTLAPGTIMGFQQIISYFGHSFIPDLRGFFVMVGDAIKGYFSALGQTIINYVTSAGNALRSFFIMVGDFIIGVAHSIGNAFADLWRSITGGGQATLVGWFRSLPGQILGAVGNLGNLLVQAGRNLMQGLINGVRDMIPSLQAAIAGAAAAIRRFLPFSPAKEGPLSGKGDPLYSGQEIVNRLGEGMHMEIPSLRSTTAAVANNITFGMGAIVQNFQGVPSQTQAAGIGRAVGNGINTELANRDTRLAVRTL
jgi:hypothetical protein